MRARSSLRLLPCAMVLSMAQMFGPGEAMAQTAIAGMVRQSETRLSPMIGGRLASISVTPGQRVRRGDVLAIIDNPELAASVVEARAAVASVAAERARVLAGSRDEDIAIARQAAEAGPVTEERALLDARLSLANASLADLEARFDKTRLTALIDGTIGMRIVELGEIVPAGRAVLTMIPDRKLWLGFTLREDALQGLAVGQAVTVRKADGSLLEARVTELRPLGEFATWRAARAVGDRDLSSFRLRLEPLQHDAQIEPGMTVWLPRRP